MMARPEVESHEPDVTVMLSRASREWEEIHRDRRAYQKALRVVGAFLDEHGAARANIVEVLDGFVVRYQPTTRDVSFSTVHLTRDRLRSLHRTMAGGGLRRLFGRSKQRGKLAGRYEDTLRALGYELDGSQAYSLLLDEVDDGFVLTYERVNASKGYVVRKRMVFLTEDALSQVLEQARNRRIGHKRRVRALLAS